MRAGYEGTCDLKEVRSCLGGHTIPIVVGLMILHRIVLGVIMPHADEEAHGPRCSMSPLSSKFIT